jgi:hypothetical protein
MGMYRAYKTVVTAGTLEKVVGEHRILITGTYNLADRLAKGRLRRYPLPRIRSPYTQLHLSNVNPNRG